MTNKAAVSAMNSPSVRGHSRSKLKFHRKKKMPAHQLPFIRRIPGVVGASFWAVPKTGHFSGGCGTGEALAKIFLKHLREHGASPCGMLQKIVLSMMDSACCDDLENKALRGQVVGFFSVLELWIEGAAKHLGEELDQLDNNALLKMANLGLDFQIPADD